MGDITPVVDKKEPTRMTSAAKAVKAGTTMIAERITTNNLMTHTLDILSLGCDHKAPAISGIFFCL
ncbi:hypothetical protein [Magnetospirillum sp. 64-120]|uniref:hypothetical protein n=1 Tax=Magnetospirillum sp. 64-120 TaxID=1895778 RepID=UPI0025C4A320|nr:hypothetical protein [Magnetospirillum sp. 64-120]